MKLVDKIFIGFLPALIFVVFVTGQARAGGTVPEALIGKVIRVDHGWSRSQKYGEFNFSADRVSTSGDFVSVKNVEINADTVTIDFDARIYKKVRGSSITWKLGDPTGVMTILDCENNCRNSVKITEQ